VTYAYKGEPERVFLREIVAEYNAKHIDCWIKSTSMGFYSIDYVLKKGKIPRDREFNPDIFIKMKNIIIVLEIKDNEEIKNPSLENIWKNEYALAYFARLNEKLKESNVNEEYQFHFIAESDVFEFFTRVQEDTVFGYQSHLDVKLKEAFRNL
jgi:type III restriction enzyme